MKIKFISVILPVLIFVTIIAIVYLSQGVQRIFDNEVQRNFNKPPVQKETLTDNDIEKLPAVVQKYLLYAGVLGKEKVSKLRTVTEIDIKLGPEIGWSRMTAEEYNFFDRDPARVVLMKFVIKGIPVVGLDYYIDGHGGMMMTAWIDHGY